MDLLGFLLHKLQVEIVVRDNQIRREDSKCQSSEMNGKTSQ